MLAPDARAPASATALLGNLGILVPMAGLIDVTAERGRLTRQRERAAGDLGRCDAKLGNESFTNKAPAAVVAKERARQAELQQELAQLDAQLERLEQLA